MLTKHKDWLISSHTRTHTKPSTNACITGDGLIERKQQIEERRKETTNQYAEEKRWVFSWLRRRVKTKMSEREEESSWPQVRFIERISPPKPLMDLIIYNVCIFYCTILSRSLLSLDIGLWGCFSHWSLMSQCCCSSQTCRIASFYATVNCDLCLWLLRMFKLV